MLSIICAYAQMNYNEFGARSKGVGNSNATTADEWSIFNNVGGISGAGHGAAFGENSKIRNENGVYWGLKINPISGLHVSSYLDLFSKISCR